MTKSPKVGDIFEIILSQGKKTYGQYLNHSKMGPIIQVYDLIVDNSVPVDQITKSKLLFAPIITGLHAAVRAGVWKVVGHKTVISFVHPKFVTAFFDENTGKAKSWSCWDGQKFIKIGSVLPEEYKKYEYLIVWNSTDIVRRIETGEYIFPFADLINNNQFTPLK